MTVYEQAIVEKLTQIAGSLASLADSLKKLGDAAEGDSGVFQALGASAFNPKKDGCWNCNHRASAPMDEFVHLECDIDGAVVGNSYHCDYWEAKETADP